MDLNIKDVQRQVTEEGSRKYSDPIERLQSNSEKALRYAELLYRVGRIRDKQKILVAEKHSELYKQAKFNSAYLLKNKQDVESFVDTDKDYQSLKNKFDDLNRVVEFLRDVVDVYKRREMSEQLIFRVMKGM